MFFLILNFVLVIFVVLVLFLQWFATKSRRKICRFWKQSCSF